MIVKRSQDWYFEDEPGKPQGESLKSVEKYPGKQVLVPPKVSVLITEEPEIPMVPSYNVILPQGLKPTPSPIPSSQPQVVWPTLQPTQPVLVSQPIQLTPSPLQPIQPPSQPIQPPPQFIQPIQSVLPLQPTPQLILPAVVQPISPLVQSPPQPINPVIPSNISSVLVHPVIPPPHLCEPSP